MEGRQEVAEQEAGAAVGARGQQPQQHHHLGSPHAESVKLDTVDM